MACHPHPSGEACPQCHPTDVFSEAPIVSYGRDTRVHGDCEAGRCDLCMEDDALYRLSNGGM